MVMKVLMRLKPL